MNFKEEIRMLNQLIIKALASKPYGFDDDTIVYDAIETIEFLQQKAFDIYSADIKNINKEGITYSMIKDYIIEEEIENAN